MDKWLSKGVMVLEILDRQLISRLHRDRLALRKDSWMAMQMSVAFVGTMASLFAVMIVQVRSMLTVLGIRSSVPEASGSATTAR